MNRYDILLNKPIPKKIVPKKIVPKFVLTPPRPNCGVEIVFNGNTYNNFDSYMIERKNNLNRYAWRPALFTGDYDITVNTHDSIDLRDLIEGPGIITIKTGDTDIVFNECYYLNCGMNYEHDSVVQVINFLAMGI